MFVLIKIPIVQLSCVIINYVLLLMIHIIFLPPIVLLFIPCLLLLKMKVPVIVLCFVVRYFKSILVLQSS